MACFTTLSWRTKSLYVIIQRTVYYVPPSRRNNGGGVDSSNLTPLLQRMTDKVTKKKEFSFKLIRFFNRLLFFNSKIWCKEQCIIRLMENHLSIFHRIRTAIKIQRSLLYVLSTTGITTERSFFFSRNLNQTSKRRIPNSETRKNLISRFAINGALISSYKFTPTLASR